MKMVRDIVFGVSGVVLLVGIITLLFRRPIELALDASIGVWVLVPVLLSGIVVLVRLFGFLMERAGSSILQKGGGEIWGKKYYDVDISKYSGLLFNTGLAISLGLTFMAFNWKSYERAAMVDLGVVDTEFEEQEDIPITEQPPPPPPPKQIQTPEIIEVPDEEEIEEEIEVELDVEIDQETVIEEVVEVEEEEEEEETNEIFMAFQLEKPAEPPGGIQEFLKYVYSNVEYPKAAKRAGIEGRVSMSFVVEKDGTLSDIKSVKPLGYGLDETVIEAIKNYPEKWAPAKQRGRPARQRFMVPIVFKLKR